jgi:hypothetical protein
MMELTFTFVLQDGLSRGAGPYFVALIEYRRAEMNIVPGV